MFCRTTSSKPIRYVLWRFGVVIEFVDDFHLVSLGKTLSEEEFLDMMSLTFDDLTTNLIIQLSPTCIMGIPNR